jgi:polyferredoxin
MKNFKRKVKYATAVLVGATTSLAVWAEPVSYEASDITGTITNIQDTSVLVMTAFITLGLTVMFYRKIRTLASKG